MRDRLDFRRAAHRAVIARIAAEGDLASGWTVDIAADLFYAITMPTPWRELTGQGPAGRAGQRVTGLLRPQWHRFVSYVAPGGRGSEAPTHRARSSWRRLRPHVRVSVRHAVR